MKSWQGTRTGLSINLMRFLCATSAASKETTPLQGNHTPCLLETRSFPGSLEGKRNQDPSPSLQSWFLSALGFPTGCLAYFLLSGRRGEHPREEVSILQRCHGSKSTHFGSFWPFALVFGSWLLTCGGFFISLVPESFSWDSFSTCRTFRQSLVPEERVTTDP